MTPCFCGAADCRWCGDPEVRADEDEPVDLPEPDAPDDVAADLAARA